MPTTTNYGWTTPADTDLVKDGASAIRTLGTAIDTTTKNLNPETTLGDIAYRSSTSNTNTRLALGTAGQVLTVNSGATAPEWATPSSGGMTLISTTTLSGASTTISSIPSGYRNLQLVIQNYTPVTDTAFLFLRINGNSGTVYRSLPGDTESSSSQAPNATYIIVGGGEVDNTVATNLAIFDLYDYSNSTTWKVGRVISAAVDGVTNANASVSHSGYIFYNTTAVTSLVLQFNAGNFNAGTALLYGVK
jgi:hypothetical protein